MVRQLSEFDPPARRSGFFSVLLGATKLHPQIPPRAAERTWRDEAPPELQRRAELLRNKATRKVERIPKPGIGSEPGRGRGSREGGDCEQFPPLAPHLSGSSRKVELGCVLLRRDR